MATVSFEAVGGEAAADATATFAPVVAAGPGSQQNGFSLAAEMENEAVKKSRRKKRLKTAGLVLGIIVGVIAVTYVAGLVFFMGHFYPNTTMGSLNLSLKGQQESESVLKNGISGYQLKVAGQGLDFTISAKDSDISFDEQEVVQAALSDSNAWQWPVEFFKTHDESSHLIATYSKNSIGDTVKARVDSFNSSAKQPTNATISYDAATRAFQIVPETSGTALDFNAVMRVVDESIMTLNSTATVTKDELVYPLVTKDNASLKKACDAANKMIKAELNLTLDGNQVATLGADKIATWVKLGDDLNATFDEDAFNAWIDGIADGCNTVGATRTYTRPDGKVITVSGGSYGWEIDNEGLKAKVKDGVSAGTVGNIEIPVLQSGNGFGNMGGQDWGKRYCDVDLAEQHARFYDANGALIWESDIISGMPDGKHNTPTGVYVINGKESPSKLIGENDPRTGKPEYETTVTYWMPFVGNAVGLHDATWQPDFGGSMYANGYGSHGCVNLPYSAAQDLYSLIQPGDVVVSHF